MKAHHCYMSAAITCVALAIGVLIAGSHDGQTQLWAFCVVVVLGQLAALGTIGWWNARP